MMTSKRDDNTHSETAVIDLVNCEQDAETPSTSRQKRTSLDAFLTRTPKTAKKQQSEDGESDIIEIVENSNNERKKASRTETGDVARRSGRTDSSNKSNAFEKLLSSRQLQKTQKQIPEVRPPLTTTSLCYPQRILPRTLTLQPGEEGPSQIVSNESLAKQCRDAQNPPLAPGMLLWRNYLSSETQQKLLQIFDEIHQKTPAYIPRIHIYNKECFQNVYSMSIGSHWQHNHKRYAAGRAEFDGLESLSMDTRLTSLYKQIFDDIEGVFTKIGETEYEKSANNLLLPKDAKKEHYKRGSCDVGVFNYYPPAWGKLGEHKDDSEPYAVLQEQYPVVSLSIGDTCEFFYDWPLESTAKQKVNQRVKVLLHSGDLLLFGGPSRLIRHGVRQTYVNTRNGELQMVPGRLNITLRTLQCHRNVVS